MWSDLTRVLKNVHNVASHVSKNVPVLLNGTVHTQTHVNAHLDSVTSLHVLNIHDAGDTQTLPPARVSECFHTRTHVALQIARHVERFAS